MKSVIVFSATLTLVISLIHYYFKRVSGYVISFYSAWALLFFSLLISTDNSITSEPLINTFALLFFVWLTLLPVLMYNIVWNYTMLNPFDNKNYYLSGALTLFNFFCLIYFGLDNDKDEFIDEVVENMVTYINYIVILFVFPISTVYYSYISFRKLKTMPTKKKFLEKPIHFYLSSFVLFYLLYILIWVVQNYVLGNENILKSILKGFYVIYFILSYYFVYKVHALFVADNNSSEDLSNDILDELNDKLIHFINEDESFLNPKLSVKTLAKEIDSNEKYVSNLINKKYGKNFSSFINDYRIAHAKSLLLNEAYKNYTIEAIGGLSGFNSKSGFNTTFKKYTGLTPTQYKKENGLS